ncbi:MAG: chloride channel protein, partial [Euryarchaeota archaeon]|nr:chloride channel protein [Euryarchaeota archaeon]
APAVFIGALLGLSFGGLVGVKLSGIPPTVWMIVGISTFLGATLKTPLAASVMVSEMCENYMILLPALFGAMIAREITGDVAIYVSQRDRRIGERNLKVLALYDALLESSYKELLRSKVVDIVSLRKPIIVSKDSTIGDVLKALMKDRRNVVLVLQGGKVLGCVDFSIVELISFLRKDSPLYTLPLRKVPIVEHDEPLESVLTLFMSGDYDYMILKLPEGRLRILYLEDLVLEVASKVLDEIKHE